MPGSSSREGGPLLMEREDGLEVDDPIYGRVIIRDEVLLSLIRAPAMQRLKGVFQYGITAVLGLTPRVTRFEHCMGVMLLIRQLHGSLKEQIAGLLHDVSHTSLSHVMDHAFKGAVSFHEAEKENYLMKTEIPRILESFGWNWRDFLQEDEYSLLEQPSPRLCADRLDYGLRDCLAFNILTREEVSNITKQLVSHQGIISCTDQHAARILAEAYMRADQLAWSNPQHSGIYEHIWLEDLEFWSILTNSNDEVIQNLLENISASTGFIEDESNPHFTLKLKVRTIDPDILIDNSLKTLSSIDEQYRTKRSDYIESKKRIFSLRIRK
jgi:hypothetical protein